MQIEKEKVAIIEYTVKTAEGQLIDSSEGNEPLAFLCGYHNIVPGLETALLGKTAGEQVEVSVAPENAYGQYNQEMVKEVPLTAFEGVEKIEAGMQFQAESPNGPQLITVTKVEGETVTVDGNHPLAGVELHFDVTIKEVRAASSEEIEHGHVHGVGGHHH